jgi:hypothetical protein
MGCEGLVAEGATPKRAHCAASIGTEKGARGWSHEALAHWPTGIGGEEHAPPMAPSAPTRSGSDGLWRSISQSGPTSSSEASNS